MNYKKAYEETVEQLFFASRELAEEELRNETTLKVLGMQEQVINEIWGNLEKLTGSRRENADRMLQKLIFVFIRIGNIYLNELKWRKDLYKANQSLLTAAAEIETLKTQLKATEEI